MISRNLLFKVLILALLVTSCGKKMYVKDNVYSAQVNPGGIQLEVPLYDAEDVYSRDGSILEHREYLKHEIQNIISYRYTETGRLANVMKFSRDGLLWKKIFSYDDVNNVVIERTYRGDSEFLGKNYEYKDTDGRVVRRDYFRSNGSLIYSDSLFYDESGRTIRSIRSHGNFKQYELFRYDSLGRRIETRLFYEGLDGGKITKCAYDDDNRVETIYQDGNLLHTIIYDKYDNVITKIDHYFQSDGNLTAPIKGVEKTYETHYEYIYDKQGNWEEKREYETNARLLTKVYKRKVQYYRPLRREYPLLYSSPVYILRSPNAYAYHISTNCKAVKNRNLQTLSRWDAEMMGRKACKYCSKPAHYTVKEDSSFKNIKEETPLVEERPILEFDDNWVQEIEDEIRSHEGKYR